MAEHTSQIIWTKIDEAPALASYSLLPIVNAFTKQVGVRVITKDISLAGRIIANFPDNLSEEQKIPDYLSELGELSLTPEANIIKLPNISASVPQLKAAIKELQEKGYTIPDYPEDAESEKEKEIQLRYAKVLGSAVNPVLREGNSDRRAAKSVKMFAQKNPHKMMKDWPKESKSYVSHMDDNDFYGNEKSVTTDKDVLFEIELHTKSGKVIILKKGLSATAGEIIDGTFMSKDALRDFYKKQITETKDKGILLSLHLKATMMKVSDPIIFGHACEIFYQEVFEKHAEVLEEAGVNPNYGLGDLYEKIEKLDEGKRKEIEEDILELYKIRPELAMVDSDKGITNLHVPNNIIIDASMPVVIRDGGRMWGPDGTLKDTNAMIPDRSYAGMYQVVIEDCKKNGAFDPKSMGAVSNVGLMAKKAEEYGSHPTTFEIPEDGTVYVKDTSGAVIMSHQVELGDIWRLSRVKDIAVKSWVKLGVNRAQITKTPAVFWLDKNRAHDAQLIKKVNTYLKDYDLDGLEILIMAPVDAMKFTLDRSRKGEDTISITGNVLRDYLTDLFPILELGTSAKMLSIVPLLNGGGLFETGAGGSAPKHVQQFLSEGHLRWDSLGEFLALAESLDHFSRNFHSTKAQILSETLETAVSRYLENGKSPSRKAGELDNRGSHFYLAMYWAEALSQQKVDTDLAEQFKTVADQFMQNESKILEEIASAEGKPTDIGGYYLPDDTLAENAMRPSKTLNSIVNSL